VTIFFEVIVEPFWAMWSKILKFFATKTLDSTQLSFFSLSALNSRSLVFPSAAYATRKRNILLLFHGWLS